MKRSRCRANVVIDALRRKERVKPRRVRAMAMTEFVLIRNDIAAKVRPFSQGNVLAKRLHAEKTKETEVLCKIYIDEIVDASWSSWCQYFQIKDGMIYLWFWQDGSVEL
ncbi:hypothetical protein Tco_0759947 [Tanacetum coccineum]